MNADQANASHQAAESLIYWRRTLVMPDPGAGMTWRPRRSVDHSDAWYNTVLLQDRAAGRAKRRRKRISVHLLEKSGPNLYGDSQGTADDPLRQMVQHGVIGG